MSLPIADIRAPADEMHWIRLHAVPDGDTHLEFAVPCRELAGDGRCSIYEDRPNVCRAYKPGGADCLDTVRRRRTVEEFYAIREDGDPRTPVAVYDVSHGMWH